MSQSPSEEYCGESPSEEGSYDSGEKNREEDRKEDVGGEEAEDLLLQSILRRLHRLRVEEDVQQKMDMEDQLYSETMAAIEEKTQLLNRRLEEAHKREEEARRLAALKNT